MKRAFRPSHLSLREPFPCSYCGKVLSTKNALVTHENHHKGIYRYYCSLCGKGFYSQGDLKGHMARHTMVRDFKCAACDKAYAYKSHLVSHIKARHRQSPNLGDLLQAASAIKPSGFGDQFGGLNGLISGEEGIGLSTEDHMDQAQAESNGETPSTTGQEG